MPLRHRAMCRMPHERLSDLQFCSSTGLIRRAGVTSGNGCRMQRERLIRPTVLLLRRPDKTRWRRIRQRLSGCSVNALSDLLFSPLRRPDKTRWRRIRQRLSGCGVNALSDLRLYPLHRPDKMRQRRIRQDHYSVYSPLPRHLPESCPSSPSDPFSFSLEASGPTRIRVILPCTGVDGDV